MRVIRAMARTRICNGGEAMKKVLVMLVFGLVLVALAPRAALAQGSIGAQGGPLYSVLQGDAITDQDYRWGFLVGAHGEYRFAKMWGVRLEGNWVQKGGSNLVVGTETLSFVNIKYIEVPLLLNLFIPLGTAVEFGVYSGATIGFNTSCKFTVTAGSDGVDCASAPTGDAKSTEWTVPFGAEFVWNVESLKTALSLDARFMLGLTDAFESATAKNRSFTVMVRASYFLPGT
jgi:hypothetical protein